VTVLFGVVYLSLGKAISSQLDQDIEGQLQTLINDSTTDTAADLRRLVEARSAAVEGSSDYFLLLARDGSRLAGNMPSVRPVSGWFELPPRFDANDARYREKHHIVRAQGVFLADGTYLAVGRDMHPVYRMQRLLVRGFAVCLVLTIALALGGGLLTTSSVLRRIEAINGASREVEAGALDRRIPISPGPRDEFAELAFHLNRMLDRIQTLLTDLQQVTNDIAHDLRTPLSRLRHRLELARLGPADPEAHERAIDRAIEDTDGILATFASLLRIAQIEAGTRRAGFTEIDLSGLAQGLLETYEPVAEDAGRHLSGRIAPGILVQGDRQLMTQMIVNLIENALQHTPEGSTIAMTLDPGAQGPTLVVADNGPGIPETMRESVFKRFIRLDRSRSTPGSGLGLSLVAAIAELHGITVTLGDNEPGLRVILPFPAAAGQRAGLAASA
jgi:signal transduction histidine kinase